MTCNEAARRIDPYLDGELDLTACMELEEHLAVCPACQEMLESGQLLASLVREEAPLFKAPAFLATRIRASLRADEPAAERTPWWASRPNWIYSGLSAALLAAAAVAALLWTSGQPSALIREAMADHVRSLQVDHLMDVASTDQHTVKPWFMGKLDYSPQVVDLRGAGYPLVGGRLDVLDHREVAAIVYQRRKHNINLFIWPQIGTRLPKTLTTQNGYHFLGWTKSRMNYLAVSDLAEDEFTAFAKMIQEQTN